MENLVSDPKLQVLLTTQAVAFLMALIVGIVQAVRALRLDSKWLPFVSAVAGVLVMLIAVLTVGAGISGETIGFVIMYGLSLGGAATGVTTLVVHASGGSTDGQSTTKLTP